MSVTVVEFVLLNDHHSAALWLMFRETSHFIIPLKSGIYFSDVSQLVTHHVSPCIAHWTQSRLRRVAVPLHIVQRLSSSALQSLFYITLHQGFGERCFVLYPYVWLEKR